MVLRAYVLLRVTARFFEMGNGKNVQKIGFFLNILENLVIFFLNLFITKVYTIYCILSQIPYLKKI